MDERLRPHLAILVLLVMVAACVAAPGEPGPSDTQTLVPSPAATPTSPSPAPAQPGEPIEAARRLLGEGAAILVMDVRREKRPADPIEALITGEGLVEPTLGRGQVRYDLSALFAIPGASPGPDSIAEVVWTPDQLYARFPTGPKVEWVHRARADARSSSGVIGRLPDEVLGLVRLIAAVDPTQITAMDDAPLDGEDARRWLVRVPLDAAVIEGVPADTPDAAAVRRAYGVGAVEVEVWLVDGVLRRLRYAFARAEAPYGGPDRTTVTYEWQTARGAAPIVVPPDGFRPTSSP